MFILVKEKEWNIYLYLDNIGTINVKNKQPFGLVLDKKKPNKAVWCRHFILNETALFWDIKNYGSCIIFLDNEFAN